MKKVDQEFTDRSWKEMQKILDAEMPQNLADKKEKKRYLLLFLFLFIGFGSGVGTMIFYFNQEKKPEIPTLNTNGVEKEVANASNVLKIDPNSDLKEKNPKNIEQPQNTAKPISGFNTENNKNSLELKSVQDLKPIISDKKDHASNSAMQIASIPGKDSKSPNENQIYKEQPVSNIDKTIILKSIPSKFTQIDVDNKKPNLKILATPKSNKWSFGILAGSFSNNNKIAAGFTAGGKATYDLDRRFTIGGGLQYSMYTGFQEGSGLKNSSADAATPPQDVNSQDTSINNNPFENFVVLDNYAIPATTNSELPISNIQYLELPIEIAYRFSEKFQISLGVKGGYLIGSKTDNSVVFNSNLTNSTRNSEKENEQAFRKSLNRFDCAASLGIGFYPAQKIGIDLRYNHGFIDITKNDSWPNNISNTNKNLQLSVLYFFGKK